MSLEFDEVDKESIPRSSLLVRFEEERTRRCCMGPAEVLAGSISVGEINRRKESPCRGWPNHDREGKNVESHRRRLRSSSTSRTSSATRMIPCSRAVEFSDTHPDVMGKRLDRFSLLDSLSLRMPFAGNKYKTNTNRTKTHTYFFFIRTMFFRLNLGKEIEITTDN